MAGPNLNPLGINGPLPPYTQPGTPAQGANYDLSSDAGDCPYCASPAHRVGSQRFGWLCSGGHQFDVRDDGSTVLLSAVPTAGMTFGVRVEPR